MEAQSYKQTALQQLVDRRINSNLNCNEHTYQFRGKDYVISSNVFSPVIFPNTFWFTSTFLDIMPEVNAFLEIGTGAGYVLCQVLLSGKCRKATGLDISQQAINNAKANIDKFSLNAELLVSDVLQGVNKDSKFDLIYWNYPFNFSFSKPYQNMTSIEQAARDPDYHHLDKLLATAKQYLNPNAYIIISFSLVIGNTKLMKQIAKKHGWEDVVLIERAANEAEHLPHLCLIKMTPIK